MSSVSPILLSVALYMHRRYGCKDLVNMVHNLGFLESYIEAVRYQNSLLLDSLTPDSTPSEGSVQFAFDNGDFNTNTLDGHNTFHTMGGMKCVTLATNIEKRTPVPRIKESVRAYVVGTFGNVPIRIYKKPNTPGLQRITVRSLSLSPEEASRSMMRAIKLDLCGWQVVPWK